VKATGDHEMKDKPKAVFEADADAFAQAAELEDFFAGDVAEGRVCSAKKKRADDPHGFECLAEDASFERFDVNGDVGELGHAVSLLMSQNVARTILQRERILVARAAQKQWWLAEEGTIDCGIRKKQTETGRRDSEGFS